MAAGNQQKHLEYTFSIKALSLHSRTSIRAHKHISSNTTRGETIFQRDSIPILLSSTVKTRKFKLLYFRNIHATEMETCTKIYSLFIFNLVYIRIRKTSLFWLYNLMTSLWKPSTDYFKVVDLVPYPSSECRAAVTLFWYKRPWHCYGNCPWKILVSIRITWFT